MNRVLENAVTQLQKIARANETNEAERSAMMRTLRQFALIQNDLRDLQLTALCRMIREGPQDAYSDRTDEEIVAEALEKLARA